jgi:hypothetical protein
VSSTGRPDEVSEYAPRWLREGTAKPGNVIPLPTASQDGAEDDEEAGASHEPVWRRAATPFDGDIRRWRDESPSIAQRPMREEDVGDQLYFASSDTPSFLPARIYLSNVGRHFKATALVVVAAFVLGLTAVFLFPYALRGLQSHGQPTPTAAPLEADASQQDTDGPVPFASRFGSTEQWPKPSQTMRPRKTASGDTPVLQPAPAPQTTAVLQPAPAPQTTAVLQPAPAPAPVLQPAPASAPVLQPAPAPVVQTATGSAPVAETTVTPPVVHTATVAPQSSTGSYVVAKSEPPAQAEPPPQPVLQPEPQPPQTQRVVGRGRQALPPQPAPSESTLDPAEVGRLLSRGQAFLNQGDVSAARLALERVAEAGEARAALALGATYDPVVLKRMGMVGIKPDVEKARSWYERAASLGSAEANQRLIALGQLGR